MNEQRNTRPRRRYTLKTRLAGVNETRQRITAAAFELHATIGPSRTTVSAIAERAGVQRHTVYHHFPDLDTLYEACTAHGLQVTGVPQPSGWTTVGDPAVRLRLGLTELFAWFRANERMLAAILGDAMATEQIAPKPPMAHVGDPPQPDLFDSHMGSIFGALAEDWPSTDATRPVLHAVIGHAMAFETWRSLSRAGLSDDQARDLLVDAAIGIAGGTLGAGPGT